MEIEGLLGAIIRGGGDKVRGKELCRLDEADAKKHNEWRARHEALHRDIKASLTKAFGEKDRMKADWNDKYPGLAATDWEFEMDECVFYEMVDKKD